MSDPHLDRAPSTESAGSRVDIPLTEEEEARIREIREQGPQGGRIESSRPRPLGWFSVFCVIANRMIGGSFLRNCPQSLLTSRRKRHFSDARYRNEGDGEYCRVHVILVFGGVDYNCWHACLRRVRLGYTPDPNGELCGFRAEEWWREELCESPP